MANQVTKDYYQTFNFKVIYIFSIPHASHKGRLKIGDTVFEGNPYDKEAMKAAVKQRIDQYTKTADIEYNLLHFDLAVTNKGKAFRDYDVHSVLKRSGIKQTSTTKGREWFEVDLDTAIAAIEAVKKGESSLGQITATSRMEQIIFRPEQENAIVETLASIEKGKTKKLWNAKMRFGKTVSALELVKRAGFKKTIIITHRPVVSAGWFEDFHKIFNNDYRFGSNHKGESFTNLIKRTNPFVYFASMQDLRGSSKIGGNFNKNDLIFDTKWDCVIIDEAHEGNKTELAQSVHKHLERSFTLELSGTPFNLFEDYEDETDIYTWDYVMEQQAKYEWDQNNFGDSNPYASLPKLSIFTYHLDKEFINHQYVDIEDKAFNFREFFRTYDNNEPDFSLRGKFVHEKDIWDFLNLISKKDRYEEHQTNFPFSTDHYRDNLRNTLWLVPGVQEARALSELMKEHDVFSQFDIINVAGSGDNDSENIEALEKVKKAIGDDPENSYTITITCGKLTTGVSVPAWTGVMMLSNTTSPSTYLQTAFRVQTPANIGGQIKTECYVFDFAPDRTLKMVAQAARLNTKAGSLNSPDQKAAMATFLNYCSVISNDNSKMNAIDIEHMLRQLKRAAVDKVVSTGFDDTNLYTDELLRLDETDIQDFNDLKAIIGTSKQEKKPLDVTINNQGFDDEEWQKALDSEKKKPKQRTPEEQEAIDKLNELKKQKKTMISILRGISIRIPMMIFGANIDVDKEITLRNFVNLVDEKSWNEFMPPGVTKELFKKFSKYYDAEVFVEAGLKIRRKAKAADKSSSVKERVMKIADIFATFKNPDKETVLTPWKVVNRHLIETLGGESFFDEKFEYALHDGENTRLYAKPNITKNSLMNSDNTVLEINSKSGLYPLLACYNIYRQRVHEFRASISNEVLSREKHFELWEQTLKENIFVIAKTPMAKTISERTLRGYNDYYTNVVYYEEIMTDVKTQRENILDKIQTMFNKGGEKLKFDVVIGNPPYQEMDGGAQASAGPIYQNFVRAAKAMNPKYISMIMPSRWYVGGKGLDDFREEMLNDQHLSELHDWLTPEDIFPNTNIRGGVCYFLWDANYDNSRNLTRVITHEKNKIIADLMRPMKVNDLEIFVRDSNAISILEKISDVEQNNERLIAHVSPSRPFGLRGFFVKDDKFHQSPNKLTRPVKCYGRGVIGYVEYSDIPTRTEWINKWKVIAPKSNNIGTELNDDNFNTIIAAPNTICTETYLVFGAELDLNEQSAQNLSKYLQTKFSRYLHSLAKGSQDAASKTYRFIPVQDFTSTSDIQWNLSNEQLDVQLYKKYNLSTEEIDYIESKIKNMN